MSNKKQSSVEWFAMMLAEQGLLVTKDYENLVTYKEAKAMHQKEIEESFECGYSSGYNDNGDDGKQYYKETFGGDNE